MRIDFSETENTETMSRVMQLDTDLVSLFILDGPDELIGKGIRDLVDALDVLKNEIGGAKSYAFFRTLPAAKAILEALDDEVLKGILDDA